MHLFIMLPVYFAACLVLGTCLVPGIAVFRYVSNLTLNNSPWVQNFGWGLSLALGFFLYGFSLIFLAPLSNLLIGGKLKAWRGPYYSISP